MDYSPRDFTAVRIARTINIDTALLAISVSVRAEENPVSISTLPTPKERDYCGFGTFGPHNLHENRPGTFRSEEKIFATYNVAGVRVFDIRDAFAPKEIAYWIPPAPGKLIDPRPNVALAAKSADILVTTHGLVHSRCLAARRQK